VENSDNYSGQTVSDRIYVSYLRTSACPRYSEIIRSMSHESNIKPDLCHISLQCEPLDWWTSWESMNGYQMGPSNWFFLWTPDQLQHTLSDGGSYWCFFSMSSTILKFFLLEFISVALIESILGGNGNVVCVWERYSQYDCLWPSSEFLNHCSITMVTRQIRK